MSVWRLMAREGCRRLGAQLDNLRFGCLTKKPRSAELGRLPSSETLDMRLARLGGREVVSGRMPVLGCMLVMQVAKVSICTYHA